jgi:toxin HigB-1
VQLEFADRELERLWSDPEFSSRQFGPDLVRNVRKKLGFVAQAQTTQSIRAMKSLRLEKLRGNREGQHSIRLNDQWRLILRFATDEADQVTAVVVGLVDYH